MVEAVQTNGRMSDAAYLRGMERLLVAVRELSRARQLLEVQRVVRAAARELTGCDGATFVLLDGGQCYYADEDAVGPLWKGRRFPLATCISGWVMQNRRPAVIEDIYADARIPHDAYRPTFVRSLAMVPIRAEDPLGAIGNYWATNHRAGEREVALLQALADAASVALENVQLYADVRRLVQERITGAQDAHAEAERLRERLAVPGEGGR